MKLFGVAIKLAYSSNYDVAKIMDIYKVTSTSTTSPASSQMIYAAIVVCTSRPHLRVTSVTSMPVTCLWQLYGDYLYEKKRAYDSAMVQYCHTIGHVDPSYVISRFLDAQRIKNLTTYLEVRTPRLS